MIRKFSIVCSMCAREIELNLDTLYYYFCPATPSDPPSSYHRISGVPLELCDNCGKIVAEHISLWREEIKKGASD